MIVQRTLQKNHGMVCNMSDTMTYEELQEERCGFKPTAFFKVAGVTMDGRQAVAHRAMALCTAVDTVPVKLEIDPTNQYDKYAVKVLVGTSQNSLTDEWNFEQAGFIPKTVCFECGLSLTGKKSGYTTCDCGAPLGALNHLAENVSKHISLHTGNTYLEVAVEGVHEQPEVKNSNIGIKIAMRICESRGYDGHNPVIKYLIENNK